MGPRGGGRPEEPCARQRFHCVTKRFPLRRALQTSFGGDFGDAFVAKFRRSGRKLVYSTYLGGSGDQVPGPGFEEFAWGIAVDPAGSTYVTGNTDSSDFPLAAPIQATHGGEFDAFLLKLDRKGRRLLYSTFLGGSDFEVGYGVAVDPRGFASVVGFTRSSDYPVADPLQPVLAGLEDVFVATIYDE